MVFPCLIYYPVWSRQGHIKPAAEKSWFIMVSVMENCPHTTGEALHGHQGHDKMPGPRVFTLTDETAELPAQYQGVLNPPNAAKHLTWASI